VGELFAKHMLEPAPSLATFAPRTPPHIVKAVARALAKDLDDRFADMKAFRDALNGEAEASAPEAPRPRRVATQPATFSGTRSMSAELPPEQTTLSSAVSELDGELEGFPRKSRKGLIIGLTLAVGAVAVAFVALRKKPTPPPIVAVAPPPAPSTPPPPPAAPVVSVTFEVEPPGAHVFRKGEGDAKPEDMGAVPLELKLPRSGEEIAFLLRADGHKDRSINVDLNRDQVLHVSLERLPVADKKPPGKPGPAPRPAKPKKPVIHDADGLAVPSF